jgi:hypothetical protein
LLLTPEAEAIDIDVQRFVCGDGAAAALYLRM